MKLYIFMKHISNKAILVFVFVLLLVPLQSCENVVKKVVKESADKSVKLGVEKVAEEAGERTLRVLGEKSVREVPWDDVLKALERENPLLGKSLKKLSKTFKKRLAQSIQSDYRVYRAVLSSPSILDDFQEFVKHDSKLCNDSDLFIWFARSEYEGVEQGVESFLRHIRVTNHGGSLTLIDNISGNEIAEIRNGIITLTSAFESTGSRIISPKSIIRQELCPNSVYKIRYGAGTQYLYNVDELGRIYSVKANGVKVDEIFPNIFDIQHSINLGPEGDELLSMLKSVNKEDSNITVAFSYVDDLPVPAYVRINNSDNGISRTLLNKTMAKLDNNASEAVSRSFSSIGDDYAILRDATASAEQKARAIRSIDMKYREDPLLEQQRYDEIPDDIRQILDRYQRIRYSNSGYNHTPKSGGAWDGERGNSVFHPDRDIRPKDKGYSNMENKTWGQILDENNIDGIRYIDGEPDFSPIAKMQTTMDFETEISDLAKKQLLSTPANREQLHKEFYEKLAKENNCSINEIIAFKESNNLVVHESPDCKTLLLLPREIHDNLLHTGGVEMFRTLRGI